MNKKLLYLRISLAVLMIGTYALFMWEMDRILSVPPTDDIFGHAGTIELGIIALFLIYLVQWELYKGLKYFLSREEHTEVKTVCKGIAVVISTLLLAVCAAYWILPDPREEFYFHAVSLGACLLICNRMALGIHIERITPWDDRRWANGIRMVKNALRYVGLVVLSFAFVVGFMRAIH